jgi:predicted nucleotidyltransferase
MQIGVDYNEKIILFGSYAQNTVTKDSDVDFLVIAESNLPRYKRSRKLYLLFDPYPFAMDILIYTPEEIKKELQFKTSFISRVLKEGK